MTGLDLLWRLKAVGTQRKKIPSWDYSMPEPIQKVIREVLAQLLAEEQAIEARLAALKEEEN